MNIAIPIGDKNSSPTVNNTYVKRTYMMLIFIPLSTSPLIVFNPNTITTKANPEIIIPRPILVPVSKSPRFVLLNLTQNAPNTGAKIAHNKPLNETNQGVGTVHPKIFLSTAFWVKIANDVWVWNQAAQNKVENTNITAIAFILSISIFVNGWLTDFLAALLAVGYLPLSFNQVGAKNANTANCKNASAAAAKNPTRYPYDTIFPSLATFANQLSVINPNTIGPNKLPMLIAI